MAVSGAGTRAVPFTSVPFTGAPFAAEATAAAVAPAGTAPAGAPRQAPPRQARESRRNRRSRTACRAAARPARRDQRHRDRRAEHDDQAVVERAGDQVREELACRSARATLRGRQRVQHARRAEQVLHRVVAEQRREQRAHRRQVRRVRGRRGGHALGVQARGSACGAASSARPAIISEKKMPMDSDMPEFWNVARMPEAAPRCAGRHAAHDRRRCSARRTGPSRPR